ncbi:sp110 nuclear body protein [Dipodomys spectabilis]|uniref:sp110 nuclear body protein n=1 Tax=Dipodomys spectabilis TaxID=105255 RepID=UPI001C53D614|nr:sp110 nuclear body protein [Dipodomys spectabilis]
MFSVTKATEKALLQHFIYQKLEIAYAIHKPFPFFEALRDNKFITERVYRESLEACGNLVPISRVVHNVLTKLEKTFDLPLLMTLFSQSNLREYPDLMVIFRSFGSVVASYEHWSRTTPSGSVEESSLQTPQLPGPHPPTLSSLLCTPGVTELQAASEQINKILHERPSPSNPALPLPGLIQEGQNSPGRKRKRNIWPTPKRHQKKSCPKEAVSPEQGTQEELQAVNQGTQMRDDLTQDLDVLERVQEAKTDCAQTPTPEEISHETSEMNEGTTPQKIPSTPPRTTHEAASSGHGIQEKAQVVDQETQRKDNSNSAEDSKMDCAQKATAEEKPEDDAVDFLSPTLPVTCGDAKGVLYKEKMQQGSSEKCIQNEEGTWFTPDEFVIEGKREKSKDWKKSVRCRGQTLRRLMEKRLLFCPSKMNMKRKVTSR